MRRKSKQREMRALRAAGLTLAGAERLAQTRGNSTLALSVLGGLTIIVMAGVGVLSMNLPVTEWTEASRPEDTPVEAVAPDVTEVVAIATDVTVAPESIDATTGSQSEEAQNELPWMIALDQKDTSEPVVQGVTPVALEDDCLVTLAADVSGVLAQFEPGSALVPPTSYDRLVQIGAKVNACPQARVLVAGHSDSSGSDLANLQLSWTRAENTVDAFAAVGIDTSQFETVGFGSRAPLEQGSDSDDGINRRVELRVLKGEAR